MNDKFAGHRDGLAGIFDKVQRRELTMEDALSEINKLDRPVFEYRYDASYLKDHALNDEQIVLGAHYGSLALEAFFSRFADATDVQLRGLNFIQPVAIARHQAVELTVELADTPDALDFKVMFRHGSKAAWRPCAAGSLCRAAPIKKRVDIPALKDGLAAWADVESIYAYAYGENDKATVGDSLRVIRHLHQGEGSVLAQVALAPAFLAAEQHPYVLHPLILNSVFFAVNPLLGPLDPSGFLPFAIKDIRFSRKGALEACWVLVTAVKNLGEIVTFDAELITSDFQVAAQLSGCSLKRLRTTGLASASRNPVPETNASQAIEHYLLAKLASASPDAGHAPARTTNLMDMGMDSAQLVELAGEIERDTAIQVGPTLFFEYPNVRELTDYFNREHRQAFLAYLEVQGPRQDAPSRDAQVPKAPAAAADVLASGTQATQDIAIIGMHGRFGGSEGLDQFWHHIVLGTDLMREVPLDHWDCSPWYDETRGARDKTYCKWGSFIDGVDQFDAPFFRVSRREAEWMDPQMRLLLESIHACAEDAGYAGRLRGTDTGVFVGACSYNYAARIAELNPPVEPYISTGNEPTMVANRISFAFDCNGPSMTVNTACSSSLVALHYAIRALRQGECGMAFVGGVNLLLSSLHYRNLSSLGALSPSGRCHTFDSAADGYVPAEGVASVLLKPLRQALMDGDHIDAVIKGSAALHGGYTPSLTSPSVAGEANVILKAWADAGIDPDSLGYLEAHGTGTQLGDPIEINSLKKAFGRFTQREQFCAIGSAKANIGHAEGAAGIAGVLKVVQQMRHRTIPAMPHFRTLNPLIQLDGSPLYINRATQEWRSPPGVPRRAGVSSFGFSGAYAHVVIEEHLPQEGASHAPVDGLSDPVLIVLSAKSMAQLREQALRLRMHMEASRLGDDRLADMAYTLQLGREAMEARAAILATSSEGLAAQLAALAENRDEQVDTWVGQLDKDARALQTLGDEDFDATLDAWIQKKKYAKLAQAWVQGLAVAWDRLYGEARPRRMSLPTYPFARERYWVPQEMAGERVASAQMGKPEATARERPQALVAALHPLVHRNTSDLTSQRYSTRLSAQAFFLREHVVRGERVVPGVVQLEWARAAVSLALGEGASSAIRLEQVSWVRPLVVSTELDVHIALSAEEDGRIGFEIYSGEGEQEQLYSQGWARELNAATRGESPRVDLGALQAQCTHALSGADCYERFEQLGLSYGESFRVLSRLQLGDGIAVGSLQGAPGAEQQGLAWPPTLLDGGLQASGGLAGQGSEAGLWLPFAVQAVEQWAEVPQEAFAVVRPARDDSVAVRKLDVEIVDASGHVAIRFSGFSARVLEPAHAAQTLLLTPRWQAQAVPEEGPVPNYVQHLVVLCEGEVAKGLEAQCLRLSAKGTLAQRYGSYAEQLLGSIQQLVTRNLDGPLLVQLVAAARGEGAVHQGLTGLLRSARQEYPQLTVQLLLVESWQGLAERLRAEARAPVPVVRYGSSGREALAYAEQTPDEGTALPWREGGVYWITGGLGGLGQAFARALAGSVAKPVIVLSGRRALDAGQEQMLQRLREQGAQVEYRAVEVSDATAMRRLALEIVERHGRLNGVIHSAGVLRDRLLAKKSGAELHEVLNPKVAGVVALDEATRDIALDWLVLCSSVASVWGNVGQADYAAANGFLDGYAHHRHALVQQGQRHGHTVSVNWPLWADGGMQVDAAGLERLRRLMGVQALPSEAGVAALGQALLLGSSQVLVLHGDRSRLLQGMQAWQAPAVLAPVPQPIVPALHRRTRTPTRPLQEQVLNAR